MNKYTTLKYPNKVFFFLSVILKFRLFVMSVHCFKLNLTYLFEHLFPFVVADVVFKVICVFLLGLF